jgi:hypothetical protein
MPALESVRDSSSHSMHAGNNPNPDLNLARLARMKGIAIALASAVLVSNIAALHSAPPDPPTGHTMGRPIGHAPGHSPDHSIGHISGSEPRLHGHPGTTEGAIIQATDIPKPPPIDTDCDTADSPTPGASLAGHNSAYLCQLATTRQNTTDLLVQETGGAASSVCPNPIRLLPLSPARQMPDNSAKARGVPYASIGSMPSSVTPNVLPSTRSIVEHPAQSIPASPNPQRDVLPHSSEMPSHGEISVDLMAKAFAQVAATLFFVMNTLGGSKKNPVRAELPSHHFERCTDQWHGQEGQGHSRRASSNNGVKRSVGNIRQCETTQSASAFSQLTIASEIFGDVDGIWTSSNRLPTMMMAGSF